MKRFSNPTIRLEVKYSIRGRGAEFPRKITLFIGFILLLTLT